MFSSRPRPSIITRRNVFNLAIGTAIFALTFTLAVQAQTYRVIHHFTGADGDYPHDLTIDQAGNLYGAAAAGGSHNAGVIYKMTKHGSGWTFVPLYNFNVTGNGGNDGDEPWGVVIGPGGRLYGTTGSGGLGYGTVFSLSPPASFCGALLCPWTETQLHVFTDAPDDGAFPGNADLVFDPQGNIYGTTLDGGSGSCSRGCGTVYELSENNGGWSSLLLNSFQGDSDGYNPNGGVIFDQAGNLYGTASAGGDYFGGTVYELTPNSGSWSKNTIFSFDDGFTGVAPDASLLIDASGALYGTTQAGGQYQNGTAFQLTNSNGNWSGNILYNFSAPIGDAGQGPQTPLTQDAAGNLYGTTAGGGLLNYGTVFKLTFANGSWTYTLLHDFSSDLDGSDGRAPESKVVIDAQGNLYGTTIIGGLQNPACIAGGECGVVWEITP
jgi:uncharacterized repeat protein (TIGR03803 family)